MRRRWREEDDRPTFGGENFGGLGGPVNWMHPGEAGPHAGRGPRKYRRPDERILEDVIERLTRNSLIDATDVEVTVQGGEVTLTGTVENKAMKSIAEDEADTVWGVVDVHNRLRVRSARDAA
jgi:osmotically-inducible protein OsmY